MKVDVDQLTTEFGSIVREVGQKFKTLLVQELTAKATPKVENEPMVMVLARTNAVLCGLLDTLALGTVFLNDLSSDTPEEKSRKYDVTCELIRKQLEAAFSTASSLGSGSVPENVIDLNKK